jgi:hypothetical protein
LKIFRSFSGIINKTTPNNIINLLILKGVVTIKFDKPLIAVALACIATIPYEINTRIFLFFKIGKYSLYELDSLVITISERPNLVIGVVISCIVAGVYGVLFYYALAKLGTDYLIIKAAFSSLLIWAILEFTFTGTIEGKTIPIRPINDYYIHMAGSIVFGLTFGILLKKFLLKKTAEF